MYENVLVPTDGSDGAQVAAEHGIGLADAYDATLHVVSVVDPNVFVTDAVGDVDDLVERQRTAFQSRAEAAIDRVTDAADVSDVETHVGEGAPHEVIREYAADNDVDVVVTGTHGRTGVDRYLLGSVTEKLIRTVHVPVLTVRGGDGEETATDYDDVLVPTDGSEHAARATSHALDVARAYDATVHVLHAADGDVEGDAAIAPVVEQAQDAGLDVVARVKPGTPHAVIDDYVTEHGVDLVAMGTRGRTGIKHVLLGSVAENTIRTVDVPVLAVGP